MRGMRLHLLDQGGARTFEGVTSFVGEDPTGSFGILPGHLPFMTALVPGLARFRQQDSAWRYLALPGGILCHDGAELTLTSRRLVEGEDYAGVAAALTRLLDEEDESLRGMRESLRRLEEEMLRRLRDLERMEAP